MDRTAITICRINIALNSLITAPISDENLQKLEDDVIDKICRATGKRKKSIFISSNRNTENIETAKAKEIKEPGIEQKSADAKKKKAENIDSKIDKKTDIIETAHENNINKPKRGRKKKIESEELSPSPEEIIIPKKRGRKPKNIDVVAENLSNKDQNIKKINKTEKTELVENQKNRIKTNTKSIEAPVVEEKKRRGRPRKNVT